MTILPFKGALFAPAAELEVPTWPVAIRYSEAGAVWNDGSLAGHMGRMLRARRIEVRVRFGEPVAPGRSRKEMAAEAQEKVTALYHRPADPRDPRGPAGQDAAVA